MRLTPCQAIKKHCKTRCSNNDLESWKNCTITNCPLFPYRLGKRPKKDKQEGSIQAKEGILQEVSI